jgi:RsiW-degrading membrane proteinase PrsW (M82 family)
MSIEEQIEIKKALRLENWVRDAVKGTFGAVAVWVLWNAYSDQNKTTLKEVETLKLQVVELTRQVIQCNQDQKNKIENSIYRIESFIIDKQK